MTASYRAATAGAPGSGYSQAIDVSSLTPGGTNKIVLPYGAIVLGAVDNDYALPLNLTNCAATDTFSWAVTDNLNGRAAITSTGDQTAQFSLNSLSNSDVGQQLLVTAQLTNTSAAPPVTYTLVFEIAVIQCDALSLAPKVLMPVVVGAAYTQNLVAHGARGNFTWSDPNSDPNTSLPPGLTWDDSSQQLSGTVTDPSQVGKAFSLVVQLAASDVIMEPLTVSLGITVQSAPAVASDMPPWEQIWIYSLTASGIVILALAAFAINRYKAAKANTKTADAVEKANTNVQNATKGDPKSVSKSIVQTDNATLPIVEDNIPNRQSLLSYIQQQVKELNAQIARNEATINKMKDYLDGHKRDRWDAPVTDEELAKDYPEYGDLVKGMSDLSQLNTAQKQEISTATERANQVATKAASDRIRVSNTEIAKPYADQL
jgi:hypothetical protein